MSSLEESPAQVVARRLHEMFLANGHLVESANKNPAQVALMRKKIRTRMNREKMDGEASE